MLRVFAIKEVPWVVGLIVGMLAWTVTHIVDRLTSAPLISFELERPLTVAKRSDGETVLTGSLIIRNLTRETAFSHAHFQLYAGNATDPQGQFEPVEGSFFFSGEPFQAKVEPKGEGFVLTFDIPEMQPRQAWRLHFSGLIGEQPVLSLRMGSPPPSDDSIPPPPATDGEAAASPTPGGLPDASKKATTEAPAPQAVQLIQANWETYVVHNEITILAILACGFATVLVLSLFILRIPESKPGPAGPSPEAPDSSAPQGPTSSPPGSASLNPPASKMTL